MSAIIGALRAELSASIAQFESDMGKAADAVKGFTRVCDKSAAGLEKIGSKMSLAITAPLVLLAKNSIDAAKEVRQSLAQVESALASTGGRSGKTAAELQKSAKALETLSLFDDDAILRDVSANLLRFGNISGQVFDRAQQAAVNLAARLGLDLSAAASTVGKALDQPVVGLTALAKLGVRFTEDEKKQISALVAAGEGYKAQGVILQALEMRFNGAAKAARDASPDAAALQSWRDLQENIGALILKAIEPFIKDVQGLIDGFNGLDPVVQESVVKWAALAAVIGPGLVLFAQLITAVRTLTVAAAFLTTTMTGGLIVIGLLIAALIVLQATSDKAAGAINDQRSAHEELKKVLDAGKKSAEGVNKTDAEMAKQKLILAAATLKAAEAQAEHNLQVAKLNEMGLHDAESAWANIGTPDISSARRALDDVHKAQQQNRRDLADLDRALKAPAPVVGKQKFGKDFDLGPGAAAAAKAAQRLQEKLDRVSEGADKDAIAVRKFAKGDLPPLGRALEDVDTRFEDVRASIQGHIKDLGTLGLKSDESKSTLAKLQDQLVALDAAHQKARQGAIAQYEAEKKLADLNAAAQGLSTRQQIVDLSIASGRADGPISTAQENLKRASDELATSQAEAAIKLQELENQRAEAARIGDQDAMTRLDGLIALQRRYYDLVTDTTAEQIDAATRMSQAFKTFTDDLSQNLTDAVASWSFDLQGVTNIFRRLLAETLLKPGIEAGTNFLGGALKAAFAGGFADGGYIPPGQWGVVGENGMELAFGGKRGQTIIPKLEGSGGRDIYIDARGADTAAVQRLGAVVAEIQRREGGRVRAYSADAKKRTRG